MGRGVAERAERRDGVAGSTVPDDRDETLAPLREMLAPEAFREIVTLYEDTIRATLAEIAAAADRADLAALARAAHELAGMCGQIGSGRATALARRIEAACEAGVVLDALALAVEIQPAAAETLDALARYHDAPAEA